MVIGPDPTMPGWFADSTSNCLEPNELLIVGYQDPVTESGPILTTWVPEAKHRATALYGWTTHHRT